MPELEAVFAELGVSHYLNDFIEQGFDSWDAILGIVESNFDAHGVKLGHRRKPTKDCQLDGLALESSPSCTHSKRAKR